MWRKLLYLELRAIDPALATGGGTAGRAGGSVTMSSMRVGRPRPGSKVQLLLRTPDGGGWDLTLSCGMERFIGHYARVPGLGSGGPLLRYEPLKAARRV